MEIDNVEKEKSEQSEVESLKEKVSQLKYELAHYKSNNEDLISKLAKADRQIVKVNSYNDELREQLEKLSKEVHEHRKNKPVEKDVAGSSKTPTTLMTEVGIQVNSDDFEIVFESKALPDWNAENNQAAPANTSSIADTLKATAEAVLQSQNSSNQPDSTTYPSNYGDGYSSNTAYVWDENYQMYYDYNSGYYLDTANNLYYDPKTGTYFFYNNKTQTYEFHSQVDVSQNPTNQSTGSKARNKMGASKSSQKGSHIDKDRRNVRHRSTPRKKDERKHKKHKRSRSESREKEHSSKKRKKSKSRKHKKDFKEEREKGENSSKTSIERKSSRSRGSRKSSKHPKDVKSEKSMDGRKTDNKEDFSNDLDTIYSNKNLQDKDETMEHDASLNEETKSSTKTGIIDDAGELQEVNEIREKSELKHEEVSGQLNEQSEIEKDDGKDLEAETLETKMDVSDVESNSVCTGESELESGELSSDSSDSEPDSEFQDEDEVNEEVSQAETIVASQFVPYPEIHNFQHQGNEASASWPPCIRVMVNESEILDIGDLYIVTCTGGTIGRENGRNHMIQIEDINISRSHCSMRFDYTNNQYVIKDNGSQHGTFINNIRLSKAHEESTERGITHGDILTLGTTELLLHVHPGTETCLECEPGEVKARVKQELGKNYVVMSAEEKKKLKKAELNSIKKRYGLKNMAFEDNGSVNNALYEDKAAIRRKTVGSDGPGHKSEAPASVHKPISEKNKGHKLLAKMGWKEGEGLGKSSSGIVDPVTVTFRANQSAGFGSSSSGATSIDNVDGSATKKASIWKQTRDRFDKIQKQTVINKDIFDTDSDVEKPIENG